jgi:ribose/xylose/arabinose/galactoside ABC-type transport system permease subunit
MSDVSPAQRRQPLVAPPAEQRLSRPASLNFTIVLLIIVGLASLVIAEQVATGWLALGERANISRRNLNPVEITVIIGTALWGLVALNTAISFIRQPALISMRGYLDGIGERFSPGVALTMALLAIIGVISLVIAEQVITGWLALGERANIPRSSLNSIEWLTIAVSLLWGFLNLRTVWMLAQRSRRAWEWAQWILLITALVGATVLLGGVFNIHEMLPEGGTILDNLPGVQEVTAPGLLVFLSAIAVYRFLTIHGDTSAGQSVRNTLAKSPGAGAIIGFIAIIIGFSLASPLFLDPAALGNVLSTNVTNGIVAIGITFLMISGEFDLSVGSIYGASALIFILSMTEGVFGLPPQPAPIAVLMALAFAALLGFVNGMILILTGIPSFIVTLGTLLAYRAIPLVIIPDGRIIRYADYRLPEPYIYVNRWLLMAALVAFGAVLVYMGLRVLPTLWRRLRARIAGFREDSSAFRDLFVVLLALRLIVTALAIIGIVAIALMGIADMLPQTNTLVEVSYFNLANGRIESLPLIGTIPLNVNLRTGVLWWLLLVVLFQFILTQTPYGSYSFAVGGNAGAARAQGISVNRVKVLNFMLSGIMAGLAGISFVSRVGSVNANLGDGLELEVIAASVIGGTLLTGGYGSIVGALLGVLIFGMLRTGLVLVGMDARVFFGVIGVIIIVAVVINTAVRRIRT